ncbi:MAG TPA: YggS family pyridoxal phosphate-dependent enzyme [Actinomycetota bacterium]|nr:YggS family pyridoxal phosphate-dependent enzyme [Actinomycetota bacterium]
MADRSRDEVLANLTKIRERIGASCERAGRDPSSVRLVAAGKTVPAEVLGWAREAGVEHFGENYVQELREKRNRVPGATWHFIGTLQSHTAHHVAELADVVETVVPGRAMSRLSRRASDRGRRLPALIEVDLTQGRTGLPPDQVPRAADQVAAAEGLRLVGLMTLPPLPERAEDSRPHFRRLRELRDLLAERHPEAIELSMGMSLDYEVAIEEGATMVRIGTALFGARPPEGTGRT